MGMLGMVSGLITDSQIAASSHTDRSWVPENARLLTSRSGWMLPAQPQPFADEWLQVDLGEEKLVSALVVQGGRVRDKPALVKRFRVAYAKEQKKEEKEEKKEGEKEEEEKRWRFVTEGGNSTQPKV